MSPPPPLEAARTADSASATSVGKPADRRSLAAVLARLRRIGGWTRTAILLLGDAIITVTSFYLAFLVRFDGHFPPERLGQYLRWLPVLLVLRTGLNRSFRLDRWSFRLSGLHEGLRIVQSTLLGSALFTGLVVVGRATHDPSIGPPLSVIVIEFLLTAALVAGFRFSLRASAAWGLNVFRPGVGDWVRTIIAGAGSAGDLLLRDLLRSDEHNYAVIGFVDDMPSKRGTMIGGRQVLGSLDELPDICRRWRVEQILFAVPRLPASRMREIVDACAELKLSYKALPVSYAYLQDRLRTNALQDLAPEDLLSRRAVHFETEEVRPLIEGQRALVTGAAGSIGSEIARQLSACGPSRLVLADVVENDLYMLYRDLHRSYPQLHLVPEVVDVRDPRGVGRLGVDHRPQIVLHAAAYKHVPLMERLPEEAVKNNILGCRNVLDMAEAVGAERFVLISTDKAVEPVGVMGATKQVAELMVAARARRSRSRLVVVRFGNVLGSAGSVVPLFKRQIERGGPVTVTDPECRRYLMTIPEAVGLTLLAGLGGDEGLYVLEMGAPIRILDLARLMITLSGHVPDREIPIVMTGLRPGEKRQERLMTQREASSARCFREGILAVRSTVPGPELEEQLENLARAADGGDRRHLLRLLAGASVGYVPIEPAEPGEAGAGDSPGRRSEPGFDVSRGDTHAEGGGPEVRFSAGPSSGAAIGRARRR